jgi:hypothetical protein
MDHFNFSMFPDTADSESGDDVSVLSEGSVDSQATVLYLDTQPNQLTGHEDVDGDLSVVTVGSDATDDSDVIDLTVAGLPGNPVEVPLDHEELFPGKLLRMRLMRFLWVEFVHETSALVAFGIENDASTIAARSKMTIISRAINAMAAPTGKDSDGNPAGDDGMNEADVEFLISTSCPLNSDPLEMKRNAWFELCEPWGGDDYFLYV